MRDACGGESGAFGALLERHQGRVLALLHFLVRDVAERDDVAQETFLAAWRALPSFDPERGSFGPWLLAIARNRALNALRRPRVASLADAEPWAGAPAPVEPDLARRLDEALRTLPVEQRLVYLLVDVHGLALAEAALLEDVPVGTVKSRLARARERLRASLRTVGEELA